MFRDHSLLVFVGKHHLKIGESGLLVAAVEQGRRVVVGINSNFQVADHDFTRFSLVPSVTVICDIPEASRRASIGVCITNSPSLSLCVCAHHLQYSVIEGLIR